MAASRRIRYQVATSLDGYIAGPHGEADWILMDPDINFAELFSGFDALIMGRRSYEAAAKQGQVGKNGFFGMTTYVCSQTLKPTAHKGVTILGGDISKTLAELKAAPGKDIWLFGGGDLFRSLAALGLVDTVELAVIPVLLGEGIPLLPSPAARINLTLTGHRVYPKTGTVMLEYAVTK